MQREGNGEKKGHKHHQRSKPQREQLSNAACMQQNSPSSSLFAKALSQTRHQQYMYQPHTEDIKKCAAAAAHTLTQLFVVCEGPVADQAPALALPVLQHHAQQVVEGVAFLHAAERGVAHLQGLGL
jgi:hypothetical protein